MAYSDETDGIIRRLQASLQFIADEHTRQTTAAWVRAFDDVAPELLAALDNLTADGVRPTRAQLIRSRQLVNALDLIQERLAGAVDSSAEAAIRQLRLIVDQAGNVTDQLITSQLPAGESVRGWARVDEKQIDAIVTRATEKITKASFPISDEATANIRRELVRGMLTGANPRETARRMVARTEGMFNGGLTRALTIARTEQADAQRAASQAAEAENADVLVGAWIWTASLSARTCPACWGMNGQEFPLTETGPNGHQNCRCARVPRTKTWRELGFDIEEPPSLLPSSQERFDGLPRAEQLEILGPGRLAAYERGDYPMSDWAVRRENPGWRDSFVPSNVPAA